MVILICLAAGFTAGVICGTLYPALRKFLSRYVDRMDW